MGVDLMNVTAQRKAARVAADSTASLTFWLEHGGGGVLPADVRLSAAEAVWNLSEAVPIAHAAEETFDVRGRLVLWELKAKVLASGYRATTVQCTVIAFSPQWANALWGLLEMDWSKQHSAILERTKAFRHRLDPLPVHLLELSDAALETGTLPVIRTSPPAWMRRLGLREPDSAAVAGWVVLATVVSFAVWARADPAASDDGGLDEWIVPETSVAPAPTPCLEDFSDACEFDASYYAPWISDNATLTAGGKSFTGSGGRSASPRCHSPAVTLFRRTN